MGSTAPIRYGLKNLKIKEGREPLCSFFKTRSSSLRRTGQTRRWSQKIKNKKKGRTGISNRVQSKQAAKMDEKITNK